MPNFSFPRLSQQLGGLALGLCVGSQLLSGGTAQAQPGPSTAPSLSVQDAKDAAASLSPRKRVLIEELLTLINQEAVFEQTMALTMEQISSNMPNIMERLVGEPMAPEAMVEQQATMERILGKILTGFRSRIGFEDIAENVYYPLYGKNFNEAQLQDMIDFYNTPTGQHTITAMPQLLQDSMTLTQHHIMPEMFEVLQEIAAEELDEQGQLKATENQAP